MRRLRVWVPVSVIAVVVLLLMAPMTVLAAPNEGGPRGGCGQWHRGGCGDNGGWQGDHNGGWNDGGHNGGWNGGGHGGFTYTVRRGDTLGDIGWRYGSSALELARANHVRNPNLIYPGQRLWIP
jgi:nucleoid-associated protein YgaU